ncbi:DUF2291 family protein [Kushneria phosphatilytica]|uniref:DUF2291 domain-containing protein n=1 Tax=Kushneria phosphatilytica TaxID=657387 RepID=A0A1S1NUD4_9GAMM|nr:DUF2291 domain-containing protein [Kushneria phosphatilytica]OHV09351.1 hypothetical protein BH688_11180 [Kushneria phosphatilytica]QEL12314.1 DUF2291 domain-containing protein [Kushneria phosphatilytica]
MSSQTATRSAGRLRRKRGPLIAAGVAIVVAIAMAMDVTVVPIGSESSQSDQFSPEQYGAEQFPLIRDNVEKRAVPAEKLSEALAEDRNAAGEQYGVPGGIGPILPVRFTGEVGEGKSGIYTVNVEGVPQELTIRVQTGPAINGTALRDATGDIDFGQFTNQIEYQNAGAAINDAMKKQVLADVDTDNLSGKTVSVVGVFQLINPKNWLVTPVRLEVQ